MVWEGKGIKIIKSLNFWLSLIFYLKKALRDLGGLPGISDLAEKLRGLNGQIDKIVAQHVPDLPVKK